MEIQAAMREAKRYSDPKQPDYLKGMSASGSLTAYPSDLSGAFIVGNPETLPQMRELCAKSLDTAVLDSSGWRDVGRGPGSTEAEFIDWLTIDDQEQSLVRDVRRLRAHPLVPRDIPIYGYVYDVKTGRLTEVAEATRTGRANP